MVAAVTTLMTMTMDVAIRCGGADDDDDGDDELPYFHAGRFMSMMVVDLVCVSVWEHPLKCRDLMSSAAHQSLRCALCYYPNGSRGHQCGVCTYASYSNN